jgi:ketosteroid isomerase-like protein
MRLPGFAFPLLLAACAAPTPLAPPAAAVPAAASTSDAATATAALLQLEHDWRTACRDGDSATVARIEDERYVRTDEQGDASTRADDLGEIEAHSIVYSQLENRDEAVSLSGDTAVVTGITALEGVAGDRPFKLELRFTDTFVRRGDGWKLLSTQLQRMERPA